MVSRPSLADKPGSALVTPLNELLRRAEQLRDSIERYEVVVGSGEYELNRPHQRHRHLVAGTALGLEDSLLQVGFDPVSRSVSIAEPRVRAVILNIGKLALEIRLSRHASTKKQRKEVLDGFGWNGNGGLGFAEGIDQRMPSFARHAVRLKEHIEALREALGQTPEPPERSTPDPLSVSPEENNPKKANRVTWQEAAKKLNRLRQNATDWTSQEKMAELFGCAPATVNKAIRNTPSLRDWARPSPGGRRVQSLTPANKEGEHVDLVVDNTPQTRESDPTEHALIREFLEECDAKIAQFGDSGDKKKLDEWAKKKDWFEELCTEDQIFYLRSDEDPEESPRVFRGRL
jgi:hypothetical protein